MNMKDSLPQREMLKRRFASNLHEVALLASALHRGTIMAQMAVRYYLMSDGKTFHVRELEPQAFLARRDRMPQFKFIMSYATRAEAELERQKLQNSN
jgi:hypothetical protein